jgi:hypothetical protein
MGPQDMQDVTFTVVGLAWGGTLWLNMRGIFRDVNLKLPVDQQVQWQLPLPKKTNWLWAQHVKLYPHSKKRILLGIVLLAGMLSMMATSLFFR